MRMRAPSGCAGPAVRVPVLRVTLAIPADMESDPVCSDDQQGELVRAGGAWRGRFVGRLGRAGVGAASDLRERSLFEPLTRGKCLSGTFRCSEGDRERPCPPRTSEAGASVSEVEADPG